jgi:methionyl-tRNA formyltransferase
MGTPEFAVPALEAIHAQGSRYTITAVYTQPDKPVGRGLEMRHSPVKAKALELGLAVVQPEKLTDPVEFERLKGFAPDVIVVVAYGKILRKNVLDLPRLGCVNIHSSLLPRWRGAAPIQWAILGGDAESGVTTMKIVEELDAGDILLQKKTALSPEETAGSLHDRLAQIGGELIVPTLEGLESGALRGVVQDPALVTHATKLTKEMEWLNPSEEAVVLGRRVRALNPWPGTSIWVGEGADRQRLKIKKARLRTNIVGHEGRLFEKAGMLLLGVRGGSLELLTVQWEGKKEVDAAGFLNGLKGKGQSLPLVFS